MRGFSIFSECAQSVPCDFTCPPYYFRREEAASVYMSIGAEHLSACYKHDNRCDECVYLPQGFGRSASEQAGFQLIGVATTIAFAVIGGLLTGAILNMPVMRNLDKDEQHDDEIYWEVPDDFKTV